MLRVEARTTLGSAAGRGGFELDAVLEAPAGPRAASSPTPATAGGRTSGSSTSVVTSALPRKLRVASR